MVFETVISDKDLDLYMNVLIRKYKNTKVLNFNTLNIFQNSFILSDNLDKNNIQSFEKKELEPEKSYSVSNCDYHYP